MLRTVVAALDCWPEITGSSVFGHARPIPEAITVFTLPAVTTFTWHFFKRSEHRATVFTREEGVRCSRIHAQIKAMIQRFVFISASHCF